MCEYDGDYQSIRDAMLVTRKPHECASCLNSIPKGTRVRYFFGRSEGEICDGYVCPVCLFAEKQPDHSPLHICFGALWGGDSYRGDGATDGEVFNYLAYCLENGEVPTVTGLDAAVQQLRDAEEAA
jgi:hypothetical protein